MALDLEEQLSRAVQDKLRLPTVPVSGGDTLRPSTRLLLKRREVAEVERVLQRQREEFRQRMERLAQRRQQLGQREQRLRDVVLKFTAFLKASAARQELVQQRAAEAQAWAAEQDAEAARLHQQLAGLQRHRDRLAQRLQSLQRFRGCLQEVLARTGQFQDVPSMLAHFEALLAMRAALAHEAEAGQERLARGRARLRGYREETLSELLCIATERAQLCARLEAAHREVLQGESCWAHAQSMATEKTLLLAQIKLAVLNLFHLATAPLKVHTDVALEDTEAQLDTVLLCMQDLAAICAELRPRQPGPCPAAATVHRRGARVPPSHE
ncbi:CC42M protein, partial [Probosciger aterrimus]|nr:CC42M protein [Probosciger aterrimus]